MGDSRIELLWGDWVLDNGFTSVPNLLLINVARLKLSDREVHFIIQLASFRFTPQSDIKPSYMTLSDRMGKDIRSHPETS